MRKYLLSALLLSSLVSGKALAQSANDDPNANEAPLPSGLHMNEGGKMPSARKYSVLSVAPMQFTENGVGAGISYEHNLDRNGIVTYVIPAIVTFADNTGYNNDHHLDAMFYLMPGLKFYPTSCYGKIKYALGPSLVLGAGQQTNFYNNYYYTYPYSGTNTDAKFLLGVMLNNSVNFTPTPHLYFGIELGLGFSYINKLGENNQGIDAIAQGGLKIGYKF